jgi:hypothetical protein
MTLIFDQKMLDGSSVKPNGFVKIRGASSVRHRCLKQVFEEHISLILKLHSDTFRPIHHWGE